MAIKKVNPTAEAPAPAKKTVTNKVAAKKVAATPAKGKKAAAAEAAPDHKRGRTSRLAGQKIISFKPIEEANLRAEGTVRTCYTKLKKGVTVEDYRDTCAAEGIRSGAALAFLRKWVTAELVIVG